MLRDQLGQTYPRLYHMATAGSWPNLIKTGLLSTRALLDLYQIHGRPRTRLESTRRPQSVRLTHPHLGDVVIRDQKPMSDAKVRQCLRGMTPAAWYRLLNGRVYFWLTEARLNGMLNARPYRNDEHCVLTIDTQSLVSAHHKAITLSPINSGSTLYTPQPRGPQTFLSIEDYPFDQRRRQRGTANAIAELAVAYSVPDVVRHVIAVERRKGSKRLETVWRRP